MNDIELARLLANSMSGNVSEWPQLKPLLRRMALMLELYGKVRRPVTPPRYDDVYFEGVANLDAMARGEIEGRRPHATARMDQEAAHKRTEVKGRTP